MKMPTNELLLALRAPSSGWLATLICALEEALQDPNFSEHHRDIVKQLLDSKVIPVQVAAAAEARLSQFEQAVADERDAAIAAIHEPLQATPRQRPKLTLVGSAAA